MTDFNKCPVCDRIMVFVIGPIDEEATTPDFVYCQVHNNVGYEPGTHDVIITLTDFTDEDERILITPEGREALHAI